MNDFKEVSGFTVDSILTRAWAVLWKKPVFFLVIILLCAIINGIFEHKILFSMPMLAFCASTVILAVLQLLLYGVVIYTVFLLLTKDSVSMLESFQRSAKRIFFVIINGVVQALVFLMLVILGVVLKKVFITLIGNAGLIGLFPSIALISILVIRWILSFQTCIVEKTGPIVSLNRSSELTKGYRFTVFSLLTVIVVLTIIIMVIQNLAFGDGLLSDIFLTLISTISCIYLFIVMTVVHFSLRAVKENLTPDSFVEQAVVSN